MDDQDLYQECIDFASRAHKDQNVPGKDYPYITHVSNVAMEIIFAHTRLKINDFSLALQCALLHDTIEDTDVDSKTIEAKFGKNVMLGVNALTKDANLPKSERMMDSLERILKLSPEIGMVKMADRITNLQPPPGHWSSEKISTYKEESRLIYEKLKHCHAFLAERLMNKIEKYPG
ncbi:MAG: bifunctional (p)ppGpp synthetase/guanosine-3',5'-bis(diphosphate) 3'-pyrophosphohydrolase [Leptospiraceae bacterium]|nr:bifunctional (p)ppGpp synthetase/guanosine-3',5'-bis(diphosphate) 3'-pyrophosphohydrolase [Leptospiraceae bacterium]